jgi:hypothetical protein
MDVGTDGTVAGSTVFSGLIHGAYKGGTSDL